MSIQEARTMMEKVRMNGLTPDMREYRALRQNGETPTDAMNLAIAKSEDTAYAKRQQKKAQEKFALQLDILANAIADLTSDDPKVAAEARNTIKDHTDGYWHTLVVLNSSDMDDLMGDIS